ncbi:MAG: coproporphyrinogen-III oxidase family protein [Candidatus Omnitrophica bacterium]|nr:coproporphyrinogen-III oxidase family protein [Candidatus Omnitrophota bacterium]MDD5487667.1 coproporphyrinogen-III oxidase family protein [Candidatus Omnitrophota bacterium]
MKSAQNDQIDHAVAMLEAFDLNALQGAGMIASGDMFAPSIHYPPIETYPEITPEGYFSGYRPEGDGKVVVYAHIPFCRKKCVFCHFAVCVNCPEEEKKTYIRSMLREMDMYMAATGVERVKARSILVGGGTPTDMSPELLSFFMAGFMDRVDISSCSQLSFDVDPTTLLGPEGSEKLRILREYGVDRLTIGMQSFDDRILEGMGRAHNAADAVRAFEQARVAGFNNICIELIYGYPGQTVKGWMDDMGKAVGLEPEELQLYRLRVKPYGPEEGAIKTLYPGLVAEEGHINDIRLMKALGIVISGQKGYKENLTRVFARDVAAMSRYARDFSCLLHDVMGVGLSSWSGYARKIAWNVRKDMKEYCARVAAGRMPIVSGKERTQEEDAIRALVMPLKCWGKVYKEMYRTRTGIDISERFADGIKTLEGYGLIGVDDKKIYLTGKGRFIADEVCEYFYQMEYIPFPREVYAEGELNPYAKYR